MIIKKLFKFFILGISLFIISMLPAMAQTATPSATTTSNSDDEAIEILKEKVANKVTEIRRTNNKATSGFVLSKVVGSLKIITEDDTEFEVKLDDALTKYFKIVGAKKQEIKIEDVDKDDYIIVTGVIVDRVITANSIFIDEKFKVFSGKISQVDKDNNSLKIITSAKEEIDLDIETGTKQYMMNIKTQEIETSGFSKIKESDNIHFVVSVTIGSKTGNLQAKKTLIIPQEYFIK